MSKQGSLIVAKLFLGVLGVILLLSALAFATGNIGLFFDEYFGVKQQNIETQIFKETEMYNEAKTQQLADYKLQYSRAETKEDSNAIASTIRLRYSDDDATKYPEGLGDFLTEIRGY